VPLPGAVAAAVAMAELLAATDGPTEIKLVPLTECETDTEIEREPLLGADIEFVIELLTEYEIEFDIETVTDVLFVSCDLASITIYRS